MEDILYYIIDHIENLWTNHKTMILEVKFKTLLKILSSEKLQNGSQKLVWQVMHDWMENDMENRLSHFKQLFRECLQFDRLPVQFVKDNIFESVIFKLLPIEFQSQFKKGTNWFLFSIDNDGSVQYYNSHLNSWHSSPISMELPNKQQWVQLTLLDTNGSSMLYALGGTSDLKKSLKSVWCCNLSDPLFQWKTRADMNQSREEFCSVLLNDSIYVLGGRDRKGKSSHKHINCERYDSQLNQWSAMADMNIGRSGASAAVFNGCIYIAGGWSAKKIEQSVEKYDPQSDTWSLVAPMTTARWRFALTPFAGRLWAIGGMGGMLISTVESYDPVSDTWRDEAQLNHGRCSHAAIEFNGELYVIGGKGGYKFVEKYVSNIGWVKDSTINEFLSEPQLFILPQAHSTFFNQVIH